MGKLADLNMPTREGNLRNPERLNQRLRDIGDEVKPLGRPDKLRRTAKSQRTGVNIGNYTDRYQFV